MKFDAPILKGRYLLECKNTQTGKVQKVVTHNVITMSGITNLLQTGRDASLYGGEGASINGVVCGSGSGTPGSGDTGMFTRLWDALSTSDSSVVVSAVANTWKDAAHSTKDLTFTVLIPARAAYVGTITELGVSLAWHDSDYVRDLGLLTHAMLLDAEGNPLSIQKSNIDELLITITFTIVRNMQSPLRWYMADGPFGNVNRILYGGNSGSVSTWTAWLQATMFLSKGVTDDQQKYYEFSCTGSSSGSNGLFTTSGNRFEASTGRSFYVNSMGKKLGTQSYMPFFFLRFPANDVFATRELTGFNLGAGDGVKTEFTPVLPAWVEDSEKIYKNGNLMVRGVDYTCDHIGNIQDAIEVSPGNFVEKVISYYSGSGWIPGTDQPHSMGVREDTPIILKYYTDPLVGNIINAIKVGSWGNVFNGTKLRFYASTDGETWTMFYEATSTGTTLTDHTLHMLSTPVDLKYLKIEVLHPSSQSAHATTVTYCSDDASNGSVNCCKFLHHTQGIVFTEPPTSEDTITMDATIDRPWKSPDYIIDFNPSVQF